MSEKHTHWGVEHLTNSSGRRSGWHLSLHSIRRTRSESQQADLDHFIALGESVRRERWERWHELRREGKMRSVKLSITKAPA